MGKRVGARRGLAGLVVAIAVAFCVAGGMATAAFAQPQQADSQYAPAGSADMTAQAEGDVTYIERSWSGSAVTAKTKTKAAAEYTELTTELSSQQQRYWGTTNTETWYVLKKDMTISGRIEVSGTVNLILCDGATLTAQSGITVADYSPVGSLNIYAQENGTGKLTAASPSYRYAGIGGHTAANCNTVAIHGGIVEATGGTFAAGIGGAESHGGGKVTIYGGTVTATGGSNGAGIGGGSLKSGGTVTVYGGTVNAQGTNGGAGIGGGSQGNGGPVTIYGGTVTATGSGGAAGTAMGIGAGGGAGGHGNLTIGEGLVLYGGSGPGDVSLIQETDGNYARTRYMTAYDPVELAKAKIDALPDASAVTIEHKAAIEAARAAYDALTDAQKAEVGAAALKKLQDDEQALAKALEDAAINEVKERIAELPDADKVTIDSSDDISAAREAYNKLTDSQKAKVEQTYLDKLEADEAALANAIAQAIGALPAADDLKAANEDDVWTLEYAYDHLPDAQKGKIDEELRDKLAADAKVFDDVRAFMYAAEELPGPANVKVEHKEAIEAARAAYETLSENQKQMVGEFSKEYEQYGSKPPLTLLEEAEAALKVAEVDAVKAQINALPAADQVTLNDQDAIQAARAAYDALDDTQEKAIDEVTLKKLTDAESALKVLVDQAAAQVAVYKINALPAADKVTTTDKDAIEAARATFDALTGDQKKLVSADVQKKLADAEAALATAQKEAADAAAAKAVSDAIAALQAAAEVTTADKAAIQAARAAYEALTGDQKAKVADADTQKLRAVEEALEQAEIKAAADAISALPAPDKVTAADKAAIEAARAAYDGLTDEQKKEVGIEALGKLETAEQALELAEVRATLDAIKNLPEDGKVTTADKAAIEAARAVYDDLTDGQRAKVGDEALKKLEAAEKALKELEDQAAAKEAADKIDALPAPDKVTAADKAAIEAARAAYDGLTDGQRAKVPAEALKRLEAAEEALAKAEGDKPGPATKLQVAAIPDQAYTAAPVEPALEVTSGGKELAAGADYDVRFDNNVEVGTATATVTGKGAYGGEATATFEITSLAKREAATRMRDLDPGAWYMGGDGTRGGYFPESKTLYLDYTLARGLISGYKDEAGNVAEFRPDADLTRAQAAVIVYRMANPGSTDTYSDAAAAGIMNANKSTLPDVEDGRYYTAAVNWCVANGVVTGYTRDDGEPYAFGPEDKVTREQLAAIIGRYMDPKAAAGADVSGFEDSAKMSGYAKAGIAYCNANGIMTGVGGTKAFDPQGNASRCQMAKVIAVTDRLRTAE